ncbi:MAG: tetratricopeptide repeat protein [Puniceicoccaceae bacterium]
MPVDELLVQAESLLDEGQIDSAVLILEKCQEREPSRVDILEPLASAYSAQNDPYMAAITYKMIADLVPEQAEYLLFSANSLIEAQDMSAAVARYQEFLALRPEDRAVWVGLAEMLSGVGRMGEALEAYLAAEEIESRPQQQVAIGELFLRSQNLAQAQVWFARAVEGGAEIRDDALLGLLETAIRSRQFSEAEALLLQIDAEYPGLVNQTPLDSVRDQLAEWKQRREAAQAALAALEERESEITQPEVTQPPAEEPEVEPEVAQQEPEPTPVEPEPEEPVFEVEPEVATTQPVVEEAPQEVAQVNPGSELLEKARDFNRKGNLPEAIRFYKQALVANDNQPEVWAELSAVYLESGSDRWAQATANEALRRDPDNPVFVMQFLKAAQRTMDDRRIIVEMENAYRRFPEHPGIVLVLARAFADQGNTRNAILLFERYLTLVPIGDLNRRAVEMELERLRG